MINNRIVIMLAILLVLTASFITLMTVTGGIHPPGKMSNLRGLSVGSETLDSQSNKPPTKTTVTVNRKDTVWSIIREHYGNEVHGQKTVYKIRKFNDIDPGEYIKPGMKIKLPKID